MPKTNFQSVDDYLDTVPETTRRKLEQVRSAIRRALPGAVEVISYQIPAFKLEGRLVLYFAGWKEHFSLYPAGERLAATFGKELAGYEMSKSTIRFPLSNPVPVKLIERIARFKAEEAAERAKTKAASPKKRAAR